MVSTTTIAVIIFVAAYALIITEKVHRTIVGIVGAMLMILFGVLDQETAIRHIDFNTLGLLMGMMIIVNITSETGLFNFLAIWSAKKVKARPISLLVALSALTMVCSAFLDNVTTVLLTVPITFSITAQLKVDVKPYLISQILASNIGGTATLIGDPPNIMIGSKAGLSFADFVVTTGPAVILIMIVICALFYVVYGRRMVVAPERMAAVMELDEKRAVQDEMLMKKSLVTIALIVLGFVCHSSLGVESCVVALAAASIMLLIGRQDIEEIVLGVEWSTILFFTGLFVIVGGMVKCGVISALGNALVSVTGGNVTLLMILILWGSAVFSSVLDNIPFVATMIPLILSMQADGMDVTSLWWALSLGACLGGNGTLIGASANVVLSGISAKHGHPITFGHYLKVGFPTMVLSVAISTVYLLVRFH